MFRQLCSPFSVENSSITATCIKTSSHPVSTSVPSVTIHVKNNVNNWYRFPYQCSNEKLSCQNSIDFVHKKRPEVFSESKTFPKSFHEGNPKQKKGIEIIPVIDITEVEGCKDLETASSSKQRRKNDVLSILPLPTRRSVQFVKLGTVVNEYLFEAALHSSVDGIGLRCIISSIGKQANGLYVSIKPSLKLFQPEILCDVPRPKQNAQVPKFYPQNSKVSSKNTDRYSTSANTLGIKASQQAGGTNENLTFNNVKITKTSSHLSLKSPPKVSYPAVDRKYIQLCSNNYKTMKNRLSESDIRKKRRSFKEESLVTIAADHKSEFPDQYLVLCVKNWSTIFPWLHIDYSSLTIFCQICCSSTPIYILQNSNDVLGISSKLKVHSESPLHIVKSLVEQPSHFQFLYENLITFYIKPDDFHNQFRLKFNKTLNSSLDVAAHKSLVRSLANFVNSKTLANLRKEKFSYFVDAERNLLIVRYISSSDHVEEQLLLTDDMTFIQGPKKFFSSKFIDIQNAIFCNSKSNANGGQVFPLARPSVENLLNKISTCNSFKAYCNLLSNLSMLYFYEKSAFYQIPGANILFKAKFEDIEVLKFIKKHITSLQVISQEIYKSDGIKVALEVCVILSTFQVSSQLQRNIRFLTGAIHNLKYALFTKSQETTKKIASRCEQDIQKVIQQSENKYDEFYIIIRLYLKEITRNVYYEGKENMTPFLDIFDPVKLKTITSSKVEKLCNICKGLGGKPPVTVAVAFNHFSEILRRLIKENRSDLPIWYKVMDEFNSNEALKKRFVILYEIYRTVGLLSIEPTSINLLDVLFLREKYLSMRTKIPGDILSKLFYLEAAGPRIDQDNVWEYLGS